MKAYYIRKPTHKFFGPSGTPALAIGQKRGDSLFLNRIGPGGEVIEKTYAIGSCANALTGFGEGVTPGEARKIESMRAAWAYTFGPEAPAPVTCEKAGPKYDS